MAGGWRSWTTSAMKRLSCGVGIRVLTRSPRMIASLSSRSTLRPLERRDRQDLRAQADLVVDPRALVVEVGLFHRGDVPLVEDQRGRAARLHRQLGDPQVLRGDAVVGVADDQRDVGALHRPLRAQGGVVLDRLRRPWLWRRMPAVSTTITRRPSTSIGRSIASRVVPATSLTITRSDFRNLLTSEDLPTFGRPISARRIVSSSSGSKSPSGSSAITRSSRSPVPEPLRGADGHRLAETQAVELGRRRHVLDRVDLVGHDDHRLVPAAQQVGELLVARPRARLAVDDEAPRGRRRPSRPGPARGSTRPSGPRRRSPCRRCRSA